MPKNEKTAKSSILNKKLNPLVLEYIMQLFSIMSSIEKLKMNSTTEIYLRYCDACSNIFDLRKGSKCQTCHPPTKYPNLVGGAGTAANAVEALGLSVDFDA